MLIVIGAEGFLEVRDALGAARAARYPGENALRDCRRVGRTGERRELTNTGRDVRRLEGTVERSLHGFERERGGAEANLFVEMLEDDRVLAVNVAPACSPEADIVPDHHLQLERNVLDDVRGIGTAA